MRFRADTAGGHWAGLSELARACEAARLTTDQAEAARLVAAKRIPYGSVALAFSTLLGKRMSYQAAQRKVIEAEHRLRSALPALVAIHREETKALLASMRKRRSNPGIAIYRERLGTHDREPVRFCSRLYGESPDDLMFRPLRFLMDLPQLLKIAAERG